MPPRLEPYRCQTCLLAPSVLGLALLGALPALSSVAEAQQAETRPMRQYDIPPGTLGEVLGQFAVQTSLLLSGDAALTDRQQSPGLQGSYTVEQALDQLLGGSGIRYRFSDDSTVLLEPVVVQSNGPVPQSDGPVVLEMLTVTGERVERTVAETPSSVAVFSGGELERTPSIDNVEDALERVPNITALGTQNEAPSIRGINTTGVLSGADSFLGGARPRATITLSAHPVHRSGHRR